MRIAHRISLFVASCCISFAGASAHPGGHGEKPINANCPIGQEPIVAEVPTAEYRGHTIGFCCPSCEDEFMAWSEDKRDKFVAISLWNKQAFPEAHAAATAAMHSEAPAQDAKLLSVYTLDVCPISGESISEADSPKTVMHEGREVRFCCPMCAGRFNRDPAKYVEEIDEMIVVSQLPYYPLETCPVGKGELGGMGEPDNYVYANQLVRFCCAGCRGKFEKDPEPYLAMIYAGVIEQQRADYPLDRCVVADDELEYVEPVEIVVGSRLVRLCCDGCIEEFEKNPGKYIAKLDKAWEAQGGVH